MKAYSVVIVGAGQAGVCLSYFLNKFGVDHIILEKDRAFSSWYTRWDSFRMNTANWMNRLPGDRASFAPNSRWYEMAGKSVILDYFQDYLNRVNPPLKENSQALAISLRSDGHWAVKTPARQYRATAVAICTGWCMQPKIPNLAESIDPRIPQHHSSEYRRPSDITQENVLIVGSGSSGIQICEDLAKTKRFNQIFLACSGNTVIPKSILGVPIGAIPRLLRIFSLPSRTSPVKRLLPGAHKGDFAMAPSPGQLASTYGIFPVGRAMAATSRVVCCADGQYVSLSNLEIIWCTGFSVDHSFIHVPNPDTSICTTRRKTLFGKGYRPGGIFFLGLRYQRTFGSHLIHGVGKDARYIARQIVRFLRNRGSQ